MIIAVGIIWATSAAGGQDAPDRAAQVVGTRCTQCHAMDLIAQQRLGPAAWEREVAKMTGWGAAIESAESAGVSAYLADRFGPRGPGQERPSDATNAAARLLTTRCTVCHATDLIEAQRLDADGWRRELTKMIGWGAVVEPDERELLAAHLAQRAR